MLTFPRGARPLPRWIAGILMSVTGLAECQAMADISVTEQDAGYVFVFCNNDASFTSLCVDQIVVGEHLTIWEVTAESCD
jgi:hypothetical protein